MLPPPCCLSKGTGELQLACLPPASETAAILTRRFIPERGKVRGRTNLPSAERQWFARSPDVILVCGPGGFCRSGRPIWCFPGCSRGPMSQESVVIDGRSRCTVAEAVIEPATSEHHVAYCIAGRTMRSSG